MRKPKKYSSLHPSSPDKPFVSDGCSGFLSLGARWLGVALPWEGDCIKHDKIYWRGGSWRARLDADKILRRAIAQRGYPRFAAVAYCMVRLFGTPYLPLPWRWGYGYNLRRFCWVIKNYGDRANRK